MHGPHAALKPSVKRRVAHVLHSFLQDREHRKRQAGVDHEAHPHAITCEELDTKRNVSRPMLGWIWMDIENMYSV